MSMVKYIKLIKEKNMTDTEAEYALIHNPDEYIKEVQRRADVLVEAFSKFLNAAVIVEKGVKVDNTELPQEQKDEEISYMLEKMCEVARIPKKIIKKM